MRALRLIPLICFGILLPAQAATPEERLATGEVLVRPLKPTDGVGVAAEAFGIVNAPPEKVFAVVEDCARFKEFMPRTKDSALRRMEGEARICFVEISMPFPLSNLWSEVRSVSKPLPAGGFERSWTMIKGTYSRNNGKWTVQPWGADGQRSLVTYRVDVNPDSMVPDAIIRKAQTSSLPDMYEALRKRVASL